MAITRMLRTILNKSWRQNSTKQQLYGHLPPIMKTIQVQQTRHAGHCWRSKDKIISKILQWTPSHGWAKAGRPARTYIQQLCANTGYIALRTSRKRWMIKAGGKRGPGRSMLAAWHDDDDIHISKYGLSLYIFLKPMFCNQFLSFCNNYLLFS